MSTSKPHAKDPNLGQDPPSDHAVLTKTYYQQRVREYEDIYHRPDPNRQVEQKVLAAAMMTALSERDVFEIACGTGYWTEKLSPCANSILATDALNEMLEMARHKSYPKANVQFRNVDAFHIRLPSQTYDGALCNFWLSHVPRLKLKDFIQGFHRTLKPGATVFMADNVFIPDIGGTFITKPNSQDTFKLRKLADGTMFEVLKNYYTAAELRIALSFKTHRLKIHMGHCFWWATYQLD